MATSINPARVDFVTLRLFCAVAQSGSITKGAEACHLALSAASRRLSDFEAAAGSMLLERSAQGIALTAAGHVALQHATRLFQGFEQLSSEMSEYSAGVRTSIRSTAAPSRRSSQSSAGAMESVIFRFLDIRSTHLTNADFAGDAV